MRASNRRCYHRNSGRPQTWKLIFQSHHHGHVDDDDDDFLAPHLEIKYSRSCFHSASTLELKHQNVGDN